MATDIIARGMITEYKSGTNISFTENDDGSVTISASGNVSSEDTVARDTINNHKLDKNNPHNVTAEQVGLNNVDNTSDLDKPISTAVQTALDDKANAKHTHKKSDITDFPNSLPANGGNADTVNNHTVDSDVPANAVFTDTTNSDVTIVGNPVQLDGLQGGVPFSEMVVGGDNIIGQDLTVNVSGKNIIAQPFFIEQQGGTLENNGIAYTLNADKSITASGTATADSYCTLQHLTMSLNVNRLKKNTDYFLSGSPVGSGADTYQIYTGIYDNDGNRIEIYHDYGSGALIRIANDYRCATSITIKKGQTVSNLIFRPQLELGDTATEYEPYHGNTTTITPTSNPYVIPNDIRQQNGLNVVSVSEGELSVTGVRKNAALKKIWDEMGMDLLFDGLALVASPAENINLGNYSKYLINCYYNPDTTDNGHCISIVVEYDRLKNIVDKAGMLIHALYTSYALELHFSGTMDNANYYAKVNNNEASPYYTRIYGIK